MVVSSYQNHDNGDLVGAWLNYYEELLRVKGGTPPKPPTGGWLTVQECCLLVALARVLGLAKVLRLPGPPLLASEVFMEILETDLVQAKAPDWMEAAMQGACPGQKHDWRFWHVRIIWAARSMSRKWPGWPDSYHYVGEQWVGIVHNLGRLQLLMDLLHGESPPPGIFIDAAIDSGRARILPKGIAAARKRAQRGYEYKRYEYADRHVGEFVERRLQELVKTRPLLSDKHREAVRRRTLVEIDRTMRRGLRDKNWAEYNWRPVYLGEVETTIDSSITRLLDRRNVRPIRPPHGREVRSELSVLSAPGRSVRRHFPAGETIRDVWHVCTPMQRAIWRKKGNGESNLAIARYLVAKGLASSMKKRNAKSALAIARHQVVQELRRIQELALRHWQHTEGPSPRNWEV